MPPGVTRVVVGHSVQAGGQITSACGGSVWRIDVGLSKGVLNSGPQVLEITKEDGMAREHRVTTRTVVRVLSETPAA